jgi:endonuclease-3
LAITDIILVRKITLDMQKILRGMMNTMISVKPPRMTALRALHEAETGSFSILIGTILSARTKDETTTKVVKILFSKYKNVKALANAKIKDVEKIIKSIGFYHVKAKRIIEVAKIINSQYKGKVPDSLEKLIELPGVGRKTANCVLVYAFDKPAIPVDIHVHRISNRLGLVETKTPEETEQELMEKIPKKYWIEINDTFVMYGQNICKPISPMCNVCQIKRNCKYYKTKNVS